MKCYECGGTYRNCSGKVELEDKCIGKYEVTDIAYDKCDQCGDILLSDAAWEKADKTLTDIKEYLIGQLPVSEFISASATAQLLGMSRQALHKNARIKRGFIYSVKIDGKKMFHRRSAELYKESGDGRFELTGQLTRNIIPRSLHGYRPMATDNSL